MAAISPELKAIFCEALDCPSDVERRAYLDRACSGDPDLRARIEALLARPPGPRASSSKQPARGPCHAGATQPSSRHRVRSSAPTSSWSRSAKAAWAWSTWPSRQQPVRREVALKIIKPGMDTRQVIARFEAERQALAMMDHPNIAKVLDAGTTESGRPYFVMELVQRHADHRLLRPATSSDSARAAGAVRARLPGGAARAPKRDHPPRHQAVEHPGDDDRRQAGAQGDRLRHRQGHRAAADRTDDVHPASPVRRHAATT